MSAIIHNPSLLPKTINALAKQSRDWSPPQWAGYLMAIKKNKMEVHLINVINRIVVIQLAFPELYNLLLNVVLSNSLAPVVSSKIKLSKRQQAVLEGYFIRGMSNIEIAKALGLKTRTVYAYKNRAIKKTYFSVGGAYDILNMVNWPLLKIAPHLFPPPRSQTTTSNFCSKEKTMSFNKYQAKKRRF